MTASSPSAAARRSICGKLVAFMAGQTRPMWDFEDVGDWWTRADPAGIAPIVAVPTTAGTGSEVGRAGVITNDATHTKKVIFHPKMMPAHGDLRPGADGRPAAVDHRRHRHGRLRALPRGLLRPSYHPMAEGIAVEGMRLCKENLPRAYRRRPRHRGARAHDGGGGDGRDRLPEGARRHPFAVASGRRALRHPSRHDQRGVHALRARLQPRRRSRRRSSGSPAGWASRAASPASSTSCCASARELGIPHTLGRIGVDDARFPEMAAMAVEDPTAGGNPRALTEGEARDLYERASEGRLG